MNKILVIRLSSLGDVILTTHLLRELRKKYPDSQIDFCTKEEYSEVLEFNPNLNNVISAENEIAFSKLKILRKKIKDEKYDLIVDAHNKLNTFFLRFLLPGKKQVFRKHSLKKFMLVKLKINLMKKLHPISSRYMEILKGYVNGTQPVPEIYTDDIIKAEIDQLAAKINPQKKEIVFIVPSSKHFTKTYPPELYAELINSMEKDKYCIILAGKGADDRNIKEILLKSESEIVNLCDKLSVLQLYELMRKSKIVVCGDTGPMHVAEAAGVPIVMLAGSSVKEFGFYPQTKNAIVLENNNIRCRPCSHIGRSSCPKGHFKCMREIYPGEVRNAIESLLLVN